MTNQHNFKVLSSKEAQDYGIPELNTLLSDTLPPNSTLIR